MGLSACAMLKARKKPMKTPTIVSPSQWHPKYMRPNIALNMMAVAIQ